MEDNTKDEGDDDDEERTKYNPFSEAVLDNLKTARRIYYLITIVAIFLIVVLLENDPARVPVLQYALAATREYQRSQVKLKDTWNELLATARLGDHERERWYQELPGHVRAMSSTAWLESMQGSGSKIFGDDNLEENVFLLCHYLDQLKPPYAYTGLSIDTEIGSSSVGIPTDQPTLAVRVTYLTVLSRLIATILREADLRVIVTTSSGERETYGIERMTPSIARSESDSNKKIGTMLEESPTFRKIAYLVNGEKYNARYLKTLDRNFAAVRASLDDLQMWQSVTRVQYNPSLVYTGSVYGQVEVHDDAFFNDAALNRAIADLQSEMDTAGKKVRIPMTAYEARIDNTVIITGVILVALYTAYCLTLENIASLAGRTNRQTMRFFPWAILWGVISRSTARHSVSRTLRRIVNGSTVIHCYVGAYLIGWSTTRMLRLRTSPAFEISVAGLCCCASAVIGILCNRRIKRIQDAFARPCRQKNRNNS